MGIPRFAAYILRNAREILLRNKQSISSISLDLNSLLHRAYGMVYTHNIDLQGKKLITEGTNILNEEEHLIDAIKQIIKGIGLIEEGTKLIKKGELQQIETENIEAINYSKTLITSGKKSITKGKKLLDQGVKLKDNKMIKKGKKLINDGKNSIEQGKEISSNITVINKINNNTKDSIEDGNIKILQGKEIIETNIALINNADFIEKIKLYLINNDNITNDLELILREKYVKLDQARKMITEGKILVNQGKILGEIQPLRRVDLSEDEIKQLDSDYRSTVWSLIMNVVAEFGDIDALILAIDGSAVGSKIFAQASRRSKATLTKDLTQVFDSNVITPGTPFMIDLDAYLLSNIEKYRTNLPEKVIYSGHLTEGEGEHKIFELFRQGQVKGHNGAHIVYGLDADLIMLSLLSPQDKIILSRESTKDMIDIDKLKIYLYNRLQTKTAVEDFVIMMFLIGNDFLPHHFSLNEMGDAIDLMINIYINDTYKFTDDNNELNLIDLHRFLDKLAQNEKKLLLDLSMRDDYKSTVLDAGKTPQGFNIKLYRQSFYNKALGNRGEPNTILNLLSNYTPTKEDMEQDPKNNLTLVTKEFLNPVTDTNIQDMVKTYIRTMCWNYLYYTKGTAAVNHDWVYPYYYSPMLSDLAFYSKNITFMRGYKAYLGMIRFNPIHQLLSVLPRQSIAIVPPEIRHLYEIGSPIFDLFPNKFINDQEGKIFQKRPGQQTIDYGIAIIPIADRRRIINVVSQITFTPSRQLLWQPKPNLISIIKKPKPKKINYDNVNFVSTIDRLTNTTYRPDLQPRNPTQIQRQPRQNYQQTQQTEQYQQRQPRQNYQQTEQYQQRRPKQNYQQTDQPRQQMEQYQQRPPRQNYQPTQQYQPRQDTQQTQQSPQRQQYQQRQTQQSPRRQQKQELTTSFNIVKPQTDTSLLSKMLDLGPIKQYIITGKTVTKTTAKEQVLSIDWNEEI